MTLSSRLNLAILAGSMMMMTQPKKGSGGVFLTTVTSSVLCHYTRTHDTRSLVMAVSSLFITLDVAVLVTHCFRHY